jgi:signal transduction histidine kinase
MPGQAGVTLREDDAGPGIPEADLDRVFQPFQRLEASRNSGTGGVGPGLAIARRAVGNEGGTVRLGNRRDGGLRAEVSLPCAAALQHAPALRLAHGAGHEAA